MTANPMTLAEAADLRVFWDRRGGGDFDVRRPCVRQQGVSGVGKSVALPG